MAKIFMEDDCLAPDGHIVINYKGPNPFRVYQKLKPLMRDIWEVEAIAYWEREFRWDNSGDTHEFIVKSFVDKRLDVFTKVMPQVWMQGFQPSDPTKEGTVQIRLSGFLRTTFGGNGVLQDARNPLFRTLVFLYNRVFYWDQRRSYLRQWCYDRLHRLKREFQEILNIVPVESYV